MDVHGFLYVPLGLIPVQPVHVIFNLEQGNKFFHDFNFLFIEKYFTLASSIYKIIPSRQDAKKCYPVQSMKMSPLPDTPPVPGRPLSQALIHYVLLQHRIFQKYMEKNYPDYRDGDKFSQPDICHNSNQ